MRNSHKAKKSRRNTSLLTLLRSAKPFAKVCMANSIHSHPDNDLTSAPALTTSNMAQKIHGVTDVFRITSAPVTACTPFPRQINMREKRLNLPGVLLDPSSESPNIIQTLPVEASAVSGHAIRQRRQLHRHNPASARPFPHLVENGFRPCEASQASMRAFPNLSGSESANRPGRP